MNINGVITRKDGQVIEVVGFTGDDLVCEGCEEKTPKVYETDDGAMLCKPCHDLCVEESREE